jgi:glycosyltransferase involved in cell wall biosynthesis
VRLAMQALPACRFEIVFVDDGSVDANRACLEAKRRPVYVVDEVYEPRADI